MLATGMVFGMSVSRKLSQWCWELHLLVKFCVAWIFRKFWLKSLSYSKYRSKAYSITELHTERVLFKKFCSWTILKIGISFPLEGSGMLVGFPKVCASHFMQVTLSLVSSGMVGGWDGELLAWGGLWPRIPCGWIQRSLRVFFPSIVQSLFYRSCTCGHSLHILVLMHSVFCLRTLGQLKILFCSSMYFIRFIPSTWGGTSTNEQVTKSIIVQKSM